MMAFRASTFFAVVQVAMMPILVLATMISALAFIVFTGFAIMLGVGLLIFGLPEEPMMLSGIAITLSGIAIWLISCRGVVVGMQAVFDPDLKALGTAAVYAMAALFGLLSLFGGFWNVW